MKIVIQCCSRKNQNIGSFIANNGHTVKFVAQPDLCLQSGGKYFCRPDDLMPGSHNTWREHLHQYNELYRRTGDNPDTLCTAIDLYKPKMAAGIYRDLANAFGEENMFILSAGWGLVNGRFLLPNYDITFSKRAKKNEKYKYRNSESNDSTWKDFNHLSENPISEDEIIYFFGGLDYISPYRKLTSRIPNQKIIFYNSNNNFDSASNVTFQYRRCHLRQRTTWYYKYAVAFIQQHMKILDLDQCL